MIPYFRHQRQVVELHEQIESFLQTVMQGLIRPHDQQAAEQLGKSGRPVNLPSMIYHYQQIQGRSGS